MANLSAIIAQKNAADETWKQQRQAERENASAMQDAAVTEITQRPDLYARYLDMQGDNPTYSPGNIAMVMAQNPAATKFGTVERWASFGRSVMPAEKANGIKIFARQTYGRGYTLTPVYDVSQTSGRPLTHVPLTDGTDRMDKALTTLLNYSVVPVEASTDLSVPARYDEHRMVLVINPDYTDSEAFGAIAAEVAHCRLHAKGAMPGYNREECDLDAQSVSYILCRRFGIPRKTPDTSDLVMLYEGYDSLQRRSALDHIQNMAKQIGGSVARNIDPPQKVRATGKGAR